MSLFPVGITHERLLQVLLVSVGVEMAGGSCGQCCGKNKVWLSVQQSPGPKVPRSKVLRVPAKLQTNG